MARFPLKEADIKVLAQSIVTGLTDNLALYPKSPVTVLALQDLLNSFIDMGEECVATRAAAEQATAAKDAELKDLTDAMKAVLRYAESAVHYDSTKLALLGWNGRAAPTPLTAPGQPITLEIVRQGEGWINIDWKKPVDGGTVASYRIERREQPTGDWILI